MDDMNKPVVAVYSQNYLGVSGTFIYRQLQGISHWFSPIVLASNIYNLDLFPFDSIYARVKWKGFIDRIYRKLYRMMSGRFVLSPAQVSYWSDILKKKDVRLIHA